MTNSDGGDKPDMHPLRFLVLSRLAELGTPGSPMSPREAVARTGNQMSWQNLYALANGTHTMRITDKTAEALAATLEVPVARVYEAAGIERPAGRWELPRKFDRVPPEHRAIVEDLLSALLEADRRGFERGRRGTR